MSRMLIAALFLTGSLLACDPAWTIHGQVVQARATGAAREPLAGATVTLRCAGEPAAAAQVVQADEQGSFQLYGEGLGPRLDCDVAVEVAGYAVRRYSIDQICADTDEVGARCTTAALQAELLRKP